MTRICRAAVPVPGAWCVVETRRRPTSSHPTLRTAVLLPRPGPWGVQTQRAGPTWGGVRWVDWMLPRPNRNGAAAARVRLGSMHALLQPSVIGRTTGVVVR